MLSLWRPSSAEAAPMHDVEAVEHDEKVVSLAMEITDAGMQLSNSSTEAELFMIYSITGQLVKKNQCGGREQDCGVASGRLLCCPLPCLGKEDGGALTMNSFSYYHHTYISRS